MLIRFHCSCGNLLSLDAAVAASYQNCPQCNRLLALAGQSVANESDIDSAAKSPSLNRQETVALAPYYELTATPPEPRIAYRLVEVSSTPPQPLAAPPPLPPKRHLADDYRNPPSDWDDREISRVLAKARRRSAPPALVAAVAAGRGEKRCGMSGLSLLGLR